MILPWPFSYHHVIISHCNSLEPAESSPLLTPCYLRREKYSFVIDRHFFSPVSFIFLTFLLHPGCAATVLSLYKVHSALASVHDIRPIKPQSVSRCQWAFRSIPVVHANNASVNFTRIWGDQVFSSFVILSFIAVPVLVLSDTSI